MMPGRVRPIKDVAIDCSACFHHGCCVIYSVNLDPWELDQYDVAKGNDEQTYYLRRTGAGQCVYLGAGNRCMIHGRAPRACREWSCCEDPRWPMIAEAYLSGKDRCTN